MEVSRINNNTVYFTSQKNEKDSKTPEFTPEKIDCTAAEALESIGRSSLISKPEQKKRPESIEEVCNYYIKKNTAMIQKYKAGEIDTPLLPAEDCIKLREEENRRLEMMKSLDDEKFLKKLNPNKDYMRTAKGYLGSDELFEKNINVLNSMDKKITDKIYPYALHYILSTPDLDERAAALAEADEEFTDSISSDSLMDYLCDTDVFSASHETAELVKAVFHSSH